MSKALVRCPWRGIDDPMYARYHDEEWGVPVRDSQALFERLTLEAFQSGLSWLTILRKRENFRRAFHGFEIAKVARYREKDLARLMADAGIVRNLAKIEAAITNAGAVLALEKDTPFSEFLWSYAPGVQAKRAHGAMADIPPETVFSKQLSKDLKARGFRFVGPTTVYSMMQATGMVNDHLHTCHRHSACRDLQQKARLGA